MKTILLTKHAECGRANQPQSDWYRPLTDYGQVEASQMGKLLVAENRQPDLILTSSAVRAEQTAAIIRNELGHACDLHSLDELYLAEMEAYFQEIQKTADAVNTLLVVGHAPHLDRLFKVVVETDQAIPAAALAQVCVSIDAWEEFGYDVQGHLVKMMTVNHSLPIFQDCGAIAGLQPAYWKNPEFPVFPGEYLAIKPPKPSRRIS